jgi:hypothetical protein
MIRRTLLAAFLLLILSTLMVHQAGARQAKGQQSSGSWSQISDLESAMADSLLHAAKRLIHDAAYVIRLWDKYYTVFYDKESDPYWEEITYIVEPYAMKLYNDAILTLKWALEFDPGSIEAHYELGELYLVHAFGLSGEREGDPETIRDMQFHLTQAMELIQEHKKHAKDSEKYKYSNIEHHLRTFREGVFFERRKE